MTLAQAPALDTFTSPDGTFRFVYPQTYDLLIGERMLKGTQGRHVGIPVCDFSTAMACVIYPVETPDETNFEAAGFSVRTVAGVTVESECLTYTDLQQSPEDHFELSRVAINDRVYLHASIKKTVPGHSQAADFYRTFDNHKCYELQIGVSAADEPGTRKAAQIKSPGEAKAESARESLKLILSSVVFEQ
ncbi:MAG TPA: hypothetical protein VMX38_17560 [Verrucomicrobiae bacterium]|nr:hypothetical protein [Verrucomicrobiae bacterium]